MRPFEVSPGAAAAATSNGGWHPPGGPRALHQTGDDDETDARRPLGPLDDSSGVGGGGSGGGIKAVPLPTHSPFGGDGGGAGGSSGGYNNSHHHHGHNQRWGASSASTSASAAAAANALSSLARRAARALSRCLPRGVDPRAALRTAFFVLAWYVLSTCLGLFNKVLVGHDHKGMFGRGAFPAPLFLSSAQFACQALLAEAALRSGLAKRSPHAKPLGRGDYLRIALPNGVTTGLDIGFSNKSLVYITMSFYTMCKSTTPVWLLLFAFAWGLEKPSWALGGVVAVIVSGLLLLVRGEVDFHLLGFVLVMTAACLSGLRFTLTQVLLHGRRGASGGGGGGAAGAGAGGSGGGVGGGGGGSSSAGAGGSSGGGGGGNGAADARHHPHPQHHISNGGGGQHQQHHPPTQRQPSLSGGAGHKPAAFGGPLEVVALLTPIMSVTTLLLSLAWEKLWVTLPGSPYFTSPGRGAATAGLVLFSALLAFLMVWAEYQVIRETSALTFMVCGIVKEVLTVIVAVTALGDHFSAANGVGLAVVIVGVALFNAYKYRRLSDAAAADASTTSVVAEGALMPDVKAVRVASDELASSSSGGEEEDGGGRRRRRGGGGGGGERADVVPSELRTGSGGAGARAGGGAVFDLESPHDELGADARATGAGSGGLQRRPSASSGNSTPPPFGAAHHRAPAPQLPSLRAASTAGAVMGAELGGLEGLVATAAEVDALEAAAQERRRAAAVAAQQPPAAPSPSPPPPP